jgi:hypothetical protein
MCSSSITSTESCMKCEYLLVNWSMLMTRGFFFFSFCCRVEYQLQWLLLNFSSWTNWVGDVLMFLLLIILFRKSAGCSSRSEFTIDACTMGLYCLSFALLCFCFGLVFILRNVAKLCCEECRVARGWVMHQNRLCRPCLQRRRV